MHFCTIVVLSDYYGNSNVFTEEDSEIKKLDNEILNAVEEILEPYYQDLEVEEDETECHCVGYKANCDVRNKYKNEMDGLRILCNELPGYIRIEKITEVLNPIYEKIREEVKQHPLYNKIDPECPTCEGKGTHTFMTNPNAIWDWWVIGGRWDGWINKDNPRKLFKKFEDKHHYYNNIRLLGEIPKEDNFIPCAIITSDGCCYYEVDKDEAFELFEQYKDNVGVTVDCHM